MKKVVLSLKWYSSVISWKTITVAQVGVGGFLSECSPIAIRGEEDPGGVSLFLRTPILSSF